MKYRNGFVSNSSSSSYVIITSKESYDKVIKMLSELEANAVKEEFKFSKEKVFNKDMLVCLREINTEDLGSEWDFIPEDDRWDSKEYQEAYEGLNKFFNLIQKQKDTFAKNCC